MRRFPCPLFLPYQLYKFSRGKLEFVSLFVFIGYKPIKGCAGGAMVNMPKQEIRVQMPVEIVKFIYVQITLGKV